MHNLLEKYNQIISNAKLSTREFGEVLTPPELVDEMLDTLPKEVWCDPNLKWLDPANGRGIFLIKILIRLMEGLKITNENERYKHIVENMLYSCEIQEDNNKIYLSLINSPNTFLGSFLDNNFDEHMKNTWNIDKFDIIVGNPPYQKMDGGAQASAMPIYNLFVEKSLELSNQLLMITPSRWFTCGKGLDKFREMMLNRNDIKLIHHFDGNGSNVFKNVDIKGGVSYFLIDKKYYGNIIFNNMELNNKTIREFGCLFDDKIHYEIIEKIKTISNVFFNTAAESRNIFGIKQNGIKTLRNGAECADTKLNENYIKCYVSKKEGFIKYADINLVNTNKLHKYKVFTTHGTNVGSMGNTFVGYPNEICTETYLTIFCDTETEAKNIINYFKTDFAKYLFKLLNTTQNSSKKTYRLIPYLDFNKTYADDFLFDLFDLNEEEIEYINKNIK